MTQSQAQVDLHFTTVPSEQEKQVPSRPSSPESLPMWPVVELYFNVQGSITRDRSLVEQCPSLAQALMSSEEQIPQELQQNFWI